jgi:hypothetical protein
VSVYRVEASLVATGEEIAPQWVVANSLQEVLDYIQDSDRTRDWKLEVHSIVMVAQHVDIVSGGEVVEVA